ncbi:MAG: phosphotransferase [Clostridia bacterium]|nr:phosphotransferase [Clostridia bacterium]
MTIYLTGRIDSSNAAETEQKINAQTGTDTEELTLDASGLEYISSAGLRVILRLKKANNTTKVVNCNSEVYEIFDMTGFTEMMEVSKAYRKLSVDGCEVIGEGANGIVYRTDPDTIVKVYKNPDSLDEIHNERELARKAFVMGIPTAIPYDVVQVGDLYGSVFELLNAKSFAKLINEGAPVEELAKQSVDILKTIHSTMLKPGELPDKKQEALKWANYTAKQVPAEIGEKILKLFNDIPDTNNMLHGDFHIKNIMQQNGENLLIDMDTLSMGHPIFELAAIYAAYVGFSCIDKLNAQEFLGIKQEYCTQFWKDTLRFYFSDRDEEYLRQVEKMAEVICYTRLLRWFMTKKDVTDSYVKSVIDFCRDYLVKNVPETEKIYF